MELRFPQDSELQGLEHKVRLSGFLPPTLIRCHRPHWQDIPEIFANSVGSRGPLKVAKIPGPQKTLNFDLVLPDWFLVECAH